MLDLSFLEPIFSSLLESGSGHWARNYEARKNFENDIRLFLEKQKRDTALDVFFFANRPDIRQEHEFLRLEDIYIPIRLRQTRESLPDREDFLRHFDPTTSIDDEEPQLPNDLNIVDLLLKMYSSHEHRKALLIGSGGSGKSTFMKYLVRFFSEKNDHQVRVLINEKISGVLKEQLVKVHNKYFPIFIRLRDLEQTLRAHNNPNWESNFNLGHFLHYKHGLHFATDQFYTLILQQLPCLILLDGVDEVPEYKDCGNGLIISRRKIMNWIDAQVNIFGEAHLKTSFILTSRPADLSMLGRSFQVYELKNFTEGEIKLFSEYWYRAYYKVLHFYFRAEIDTSRKDSFQRKIKLFPENKASFFKSLDNPHFTGLISNPLLLSQAILIHSIDETFELSDVDSLYEKFIETLLYRWDDVRQLDFYPELLGTRNLQRLFQLMGRIAFSFSKREVTKMRVDELLSEVVKAIGRFKSTLPQPEKIIELTIELLGVLRDRGGIFTGGLIAEKDFMQTEFEFQHKSIQDYLAAYTLSNDNSLLLSDDFSLAHKIDNQEFWGRTLEFFVNLKKGNPDFFFRSYIEHLKPETYNAKKLHHFTHYFLIAQEKDELLEAELGKCCNNILLLSQDFFEIHIATACLYKLGYNLNELGLSQMAKLHSNMIDNYRAVKIIQLFYANEIYINIIGSKNEPSNSDGLDALNGSFYCFRNSIFFGLIKLDYQVWKKNLLEETDDIEQLCLGLALRSLLDLRNFQNWRDLLNILDLRNLWNLKDLQNLWDWKDLLDLRNLLDLKSWRSLRNLQDLQRLLDLRNWRDVKSLRDSQYWKDLRNLQYLWDQQELKEREKKLFETYRLFIISDKYPTFLSIMKKIRRRFQSLTPEQKLQYFINVDE